jgi:hypothetical protein
MWCERDIQKEGIVLKSGGKLESYRVRIEVQSDVIMRN